MNVNLIDDGGYASILSVKLLKSRISNLFLFHSPLVCFYNFFLPPLLVIEEKPRIGFPKILRHEEDYTSILQSID